MVSTFELTVETAFLEGPSERGYGLVVGLNDDRFLTYEITPWQTIDFWEYEYTKDEWTWLNGQFTGTIRSGVQKNVIGVRASENASGKLDIALLANGRTPLVIFNQDADPGWVGLTVFGHAVEVAFDNFHHRRDPDLPGLQRPFGLGHPQAPLPVKRPLG
jgi:hypothetical protein